MRMMKKISLLLALFVAFSLPLSACNGFLPSTNEDSSLSSASTQASVNSQIESNSIYHEETSESTLNSSSINEESSISSSEEFSSGAVSSDIFSEESSSETSSNDSSEEDSSFESSSEESSIQESSVEDSSSESSNTEEENPQHAIVDTAYKLGWDETMEGNHTLTGVVTLVDSGKKLNVTIEIEGREDYPIYCYNLQGATATINAGDIITVFGTIKNYQGTVEFDSASLMNHEPQTPPVVSGDPYKNVTASEFYASYTPAVSNEDAYYRSLHGFMSGELETPDQAPTLAAYQPKDGKLFVRNSTMLFDESGKEYTVVDCYGNEAFKVYRDGAYITLEEVAAFVYAFGTYPANYTPSKKTSPSSSIWGEYLRVNHSAFSGSTSKYPYEPELPNITGCGGKLSYYEMDIGTTGTDCDPTYDIEIYNNGYSITRGAARIVYGKTDLNKNGVYEIGELHVFYTYNHYNDFQEYLNYAGGWGEKFGNITGGGTLSSKYDYAPTSYVQVTLAPILSYTTLPLASFYNNYYNQKFAFNLA